MDMSYNIDFWKCGVAFLALAMTPLASAGEPKDMSGEMYVQGSWVDVFWGNARETSSAPTS
jgi:hypothetical protein